MEKVDEAILRLRKNIERALEADASAEEVGDIVAALSDAAVMTIDLLRTTKIGVTMAAVKKKFPDNEAGALARDLIGKWKQLIPPKPAATVAAASPAAKVKGPEGSSTGSAAVVLPPAAAGGEMVAVPPLLRSLSFEERLELLSKGRRKIVGLFTKVFETNAPFLAAEFFAYGLEVEINWAHPHETQKDEYAAKARSLLFNLKHNSKVRKEMLMGALSATRLVSMTAAELLSEERQQELEKDAAEHAESRDPNWYLTNRAEVMKASGLDPNAPSEFTCPKCGGHITSNYSMQLDSGDEPMTIFIFCITCKHRWKEGWHET